MGNPNGPADKTDVTSIALLPPEHLVAVHGFIKKTRTTPDEDLAMARKRQKEVER